MKNSSLIAAIKQHYTKSLGNKLNKFIDIENKIIELIRLHMSI